MTDLLPREHFECSNRMVPKIIFEDDYLLVVDKPAGWIVTDVTTTKGQPTVQQWLRHNFSHKAGSGYARKFPLAQDKKLRGGIVHRLDKETSGILVVAKTKEAFANLQTQFKARKVEKIYTALVHGKVSPETGNINAPVGRLPWNRERFGVLPGGRPAETTFEVLKYYSLSTDHRTLFTLIEFYPKTGRTHQIRIHAKYLGHPIVSDEFYAGRKTARADRKWCPRLFLHAMGITFSHPIVNKKVSFKSGLSKDLQKSLMTLKAYP